MKGMSTFPDDYKTSAIAILFLRIHFHTQGTIISREFAGWTGPIKLHATYSTHVVFGDIPVPGRYGGVFLDSNFHLRRALMLIRWIALVCFETIGSAQVVERW